MSFEQTLSRLGLGNKQDDHSEHVDAHADAHDSAHADEDDDILYIVYIVYIAWLMIFNPIPSRSLFRSVVMS